MIEGTVRHVSADRLVDQVTGQPYFLTTVSISDDEVGKIGDDVTLMAGMPAEVMIITGEQTLLGYILQPAISTLRSCSRPRRAATAAPTLVALLSSNQATPSLSATSTARWGKPAKLESPAAMAALPSKWQRLRRSTAAPLKCRGAPPE